MFQEIIRKNFTAFRKLNAIRGERGLLHDRHYQVVIALEANRLLVEGEWQGHMIDHDAVRAIIEQLDGSLNLLGTTGSYPTNGKLAVWIYDRIREHVLNALGPDYWTEAAMSLSVMVDDGDYQTVYNRDELDHLVR